MLTHAPEKVSELLFAPGKHDGDRDKRAQELLRFAERQGVGVRKVTLAELNRLCESEAHQSFAAVLEQGGGLELKQLISQLGGKERALLLLLDSINDPHNFGAILRAAECFGADAVIYSKNRGSPLSPVVSKVSAGASELVPLCEVANLAEAARKLKKAGFWLVACDVSREATALPKFEFPQQSVLILGSEGKGPQKLLLEQADFRLYIPMLGKLDSLNVSQAAAVTLYAACCR